ncbi:FAD-dependent oxidoreductase [Gulosibacter molinativorax]|uniref:ferredoxin--NADP(+) reductase n=1 Tax=Gulosibacter molinativorax TaxID=256821 RepID=A0ABT7CB31_9MICO|nr:FAD-dependent oxidoreductase [Gulosibacter molinativorax]MDJ1372330.1 pyridine nucleotide-disulfide oxidoreductase [Gulosibacter molinativorax]QUY63424.1 NADPH-ferredoxin reductase [Gulosibacter molinativorax]
MSKLRVAVIGAGPAGIYASDILRKEAEGTHEVSIDLFDRLPAPYGLVRYGVAPDHPRIKGVVSALRGVLDTGGIRVFGNVDFGSDITLEDLKERYNAVIFATGAMRDAPLNIPGIDAEGSYGAADFVNWYDGHPDVPREWTLDAEHVAVVGNGNVALDVARVLAKQADDMLPTEIPTNVYEGLKASKVTDVHVFGRRGPLQVKFTPLELRELGEVPDSDLIVYEEDFDRDPAADEESKRNKQLLVISRIFGKWREQQDALGNASRRIHLHFWSRPEAVLTNEAGRVTGIRMERTEPDGDGGIRNTGEMRDYEVGQVYRAVGYFGSPLEEIPYDPVNGVIPNHGGRVVDAAGNIVPGMFATGWIKRGPVGLIGHTKSDAKETIEHVLAGESGWWQPTITNEDEIVELLDERNVRYTDLEGWHNLDAHEVALGEPQERERVKVVDREEMLGVSRGEDYSI